MSRRIEGPGPEGVIGALPVKPPEGGGVPPVDADATAASLDLSTGGA